MFPFSLSAYGSRSPLTDATWENAAAKDTGNSVNNDLRYYDI
jgi:hypothetical protein